MLSTGRTLRVILFEKCRFKGFRTTANIRRFLGYATWLTPEARNVYGSLIVQIQYNLLLLLMGVLVPMGIPLAIKAYQRVWIHHTIPENAFVVLTLDIGLSCALAFFLLRRGQVAGAWILVLFLAMLGALAEMYLMKEPGIILFAILPMLGPNLFAPFWLCCVMNLGTLLIYSLFISLIFPIPPDNWVEVVSLYGSVIFGAAFIGVVVRHTLRQLAMSTVQTREKAVEAARLEQQLTDLHKHVATVASLEHDIRQPLRAMQGYLQMLQAENVCETSNELITPALAASHRANRLINNLLDLGRAAIDQRPIVRQPVAPTTILAHVCALAPGLASYYTDPPVRVMLNEKEQLPSILVDVGQVQRAIFNLLDNALVHAPPNTTVEVRSGVAGLDWSIEVRDSGPGIPADVVEALNSISEPGSTPTARLGLGLRQVYRMAHAHGGEVFINTSACGTAVQIRIPFVEMSPPNFSGPHHT